MWKWTMWAISLRMKSTYSKTNVCTVRGDTLNADGYRRVTLAPYTTETEHLPRILTSTCDKKSGIMR